LLESLDDLPVHHVDRNAGAVSVLSIDNHSVMEFQLVFGKAAA
jgi:hypothetical protein